MSIRMAALAGRTEKTTFDFQGEQVTITFRPNYMTPARQAEMSASADKGESTDGFIELVVGMIVDWDVLDENGVPIPVTADFCKTLPYSFLAAVVVAAGEASKPGEAPAP